MLLGNTLREDVEVDVAAAAAAEVDCINIFDAPLVFLTLLIFSVIPPVVDNIDADADEALIPLPLPLPIVCDSLSLFFVHVFKTAYASPKRSLPDDPRWWFKDDTVGRISSPSMTRLFLLLFAS
jgi:hypothetical protein